MAFDGQDLRQGLRQAGRRNCDIHASAVSAVAERGALAQSGLMCQAELPNTDFLSPEELMLRVRDRQCQNSFKQLFSELAPKVKGFLVSGGAPVDVAEDVMQEVMIKVWRFAGKYDPEKASVSTWVFRIARNARIDLIRREKRPEYDPEDPALKPGEPEAPDARLDGAQAAEQVSKALETLPEDQAQILRLSFYDNLTHVQIAEKIHIPLGTVKSRMRLAMQKLTLIMKEYQ